MQCFTKHFIGHASLCLSATSKMSLLGITQLYQNRSENILELHWCHFGVRWPSLSIASWVHLSSLALNAAYITPADECVSDRDPVQYNLSDQ